MRTIDGLHRSGVAIQSDQTIRKAAEVMESEGVGSLGVLEGDRLVGIVTDRDLVRRGIAADLPLDARVDAVMSSPVISVHAEADYEDAVRRFRTAGVRRMAVVRGQHFVGMLALDDLLVSAVTDLDDLTTPIASEIRVPDHDGPAPALR